MRSTLKKWLGLEPQDQFTKDFFFRRNINGAIFMSVVVIGLEIWMCLSLLKYMIDRDKVSLSYYIIHGYHYFIMLGMAIVMLCYGIHFIRMKENAHQTDTGGALTGLFCLVCLWFGYYFGLKSYAQNDQTFAFMTMLLFVFCLVAWKPYIGGLFSAAVCLYFYYMCGNLTTIEMTYSFRVNFFTLWIVIFMFIISNYHLTLEQAGKEERLIRQAREDTLTGLLNQNGFDKVLNQRILEGQLNNTDRILLFNIENFKAYNETYGLSGGDELLVRFAGKLRNVFGEVPIARLHGDRFAVACAADGIEEKTGELAFYVKKISLDKKVHMELKVGACEACETAEITLDNARFACASLHHKTGRFLQVYDSDFRGMVEMRQFVIGNIIPAINQGYIEAWYQPIYDAKTGKTAYLEALARWRDPERGMLMPGVFISILEEFRLISMLDKEMVRQTAKLLQRRIQSGEPVVPVSVNFSQMDFDAFDICEFLTDTMDWYQVPHELLKVEITESVLSDHPEEKKKLFAELRNAGFELWLDDFGSGYSSLNVLKEFRFDLIKIDMIFMRGFDRYEKTKEIVQSIIDLAGKLDVHTLTEGVETKEQETFLKEAGCDLMQGFLFAKPMEVDRIEEFLNDGCCIPGKGRN